MGFVHSATTTIRLLLLFVRVSVGKFLEPVVVAVRVSDPDHYLQRLGLSPVFTGRVRPTNRNPQP